MARKPKENYNVILHCQYNVRVCTVDFLCKTKFFFFFGKQKWQLPPLASTSIVAQRARMYSRRPSFLLGDRRLQVTISGVLTNSEGELLGDFGANKK